MAHEVNRECDNRISEVEHWAFGVKGDAGIEKEFRDLEKRYLQLEQQIFKWGYMVAGGGLLVSATWAIFEIYLRYFRK